MSLVASESTRVMQAIQDCLKLLCGTACFTLGISQGCLTECVTLILRRLQLLQRTQATAM